MQSVYGLKVMIDNKTHTKEWYYTITKKKMGTKELKKLIKWFGMSIESC